MYRKSADALLACEPRAGWALYLLYTMAHYFLSAQNTN
jgi:hypothetical protein